MHIFWQIECLSEVFGYIVIEIAWINMIIS